MAADEDELVELKEENEELHSRIRELEKMLEDQGDTVVGVRSSAGVPGRKSMFHKKSIAVPRFDDKRDSSDRGLMLFQNATGRLIKDGLKRQIEEEDHKIHELESALTKAQDKLKSSYEENRSLKKLIEETQKSHGSAGASEQQLAIKVAELEAQNRTATAKIKDLEEDLEEMQVKFAHKAHLAGADGGLSQELGGFGGRGSLSGLHLEDDDEDPFSAMDTEGGSAAAGGKQRIRELLQEVSDLQAELRDAEEAKREMAEALASAPAHGAQTDEIQALQEQLKNAQAAASRAAADLERTQKEAQEWKDKASSTAASTGASEKELNELRDKLKSAEALKAELEGKAAEFKEKMEAAIKQHEAASQEIGGLKDSVAAAKSQLQALEQEHLRLKESAQASDEKLRAEVSALQDKLKAADEAVAKVQAELKQHQDEAQRLKAAGEQAGASKEQTETETKELRSALQAAQEAQKELQKQVVVNREEAAKFKQEAAVAEENHSKAKVEIEELRKSLSSAKNAQEQLQEDVNAAKGVAGKSGELEAEVANLKEKLRQAELLQQQLQEGAKQGEDSAKLRAELAALRDELKKKEDAAEDLRQRAATAAALEEQLAAAKAELKRQQDEAQSWKEKASAAAPTVKKKSLSSEVTDLQMKLAASEKAQRELLEQLSSQKSQAGAAEELAAVRQQLAELSARRQSEVQGLQEELDRLRKQQEEERRLTANSDKDELLRRIRALEAEILEWRAILTRCERKSPKSWWTSMMCLRDSPDRPRVIGVD